MELAFDVPGDSELVGVGVGAPREERDAYSPSLFFAHPSPKLGADVPPLDLGPPCALQDAGTDFESMNSPEPDEGDPFVSSPHTNAGDSEQPDELDLPDLGLGLDELGNLEDVVLSSPAHPHNDHDHDPFLLAPLDPACPSTPGGPLSYIEGLEDEVQGSPQREQEKPLCPAVIPQQAELQPSPPLVILPPTFPPLEVPILPLPPSAARPAAPPPPPPSRPAPSKPASASQKKAPRAATAASAKPKAEAKEGGGEEEANAASRSRKKRALPASAVPDDDLSPEQLAKRMRRRQRNKESAQQSRLRKKMFMDELSGHVSSLSAENATLVSQMRELLAENERLKQALQANAIPQPLLPPRPPSLFAGPNTVKRATTALFSVALLALIVTSPLGTEDGAPEQWHDAVVGRSLSAMPSSSDLLVEDDEFERRQQPVVIPPQNPRPPSPANTSVQLLLNNSAGEVHDNVAQTLQLLQPSTHFEHRYGSLLTWQALQFIKERGRRRTQYVMCTQAHSIWIGGEDAPAQHHLDEETIVLDAPSNSTKRSRAEARRGKRDGAHEPFVIGGGVDDGSASSELSVIEHMLLSPSESDRPVSMLLPVGILDDNLGASKSRSHAFDEMVCPCKPNVTGHFAPFPALVGPLGG